MRMERHITVSGFVVHEGRVALHWHRKIGMWLPAGGHIEPGEDPVQAVLREIARRVRRRSRGPAPRAAASTTPAARAQLEPPFAILDCWPEPDHGHVDLVYFCRAPQRLPRPLPRPRQPDPLARPPNSSPKAAPSSATATCVAFAPDVQALALEAIRLAAEDDADSRLTPTPHHG